MYNVILYDLKEELEELALEEDFERGNLFEKEINDAKGLTSGRERRKSGVFDVVLSSALVSVMVIEAMSISFGRVSTTLQGNFTGSRGLVSNSSFLLSPLLYREKFDDLVNSFRGKLGTGRGEMAEDVYRGGRILLISVRDRYLTKLMGKVCYVDRFKGEIEVYTSKNSCGEISFD